VGSTALGIVPLGDRAFAIRTGEDVGIGELRTKAGAIAERGLPWLEETFASPGKIVFYLNEAAPSLEEAAQEAARLYGTLEGSAAAAVRTVRLPIVYGGEEGPDLAECAARSGLTETGFAERHAQAVYEVEMMGFSPGFPYLSGLDEAIVQPRKSEPRLRVPAGSVGIAGSRTCVYPVQSPGGWQLIGRTAEPLFRPERDEPFLLSPGDRVRFVPVSASRPPSSAEKPGSIAYAPGLPALTVLKPGLHTTVQDSGRPGWRAYGVSAGGAMDDRSARLANLLVGNGEGEAVLELTLAGGTFLAERDLAIALCGADLSARLDGEPLPANRPVFVAKGATVRFGPAARGCRAYLAIAGGIDVPRVLGGRGTDAKAGLGGGYGRPLAAGDAIGASRMSPRSAALLRALKSRAEDGLGPVGWFATDAVGISSLPKRTAWNGGKVLALRLLAGEEWDDFAPEAQAALFGSFYRVGLSSDRMGLRLDGEPLTRVKGGELASHGIAPGTIQVPPNGQPIALGADCQPTGGYPKIAHVIGADLSLLAQAAPGDRLVFVRATLREAEQVRREAAIAFARLRAAVRLRLSQLIGKDIGP